MGVTVPNVEVRIAQSKLKQSGPLLITHWGFSGPAILKLSAWGAIELAALKYDFKGYVNWVPEFDENSLKSEMRRYRVQLAAAKMTNRNPFGLPSRLWDFLLQASDIASDIRWADLPAKKQNILVKQLCSYEFHVKGKTTFKEEFVTAGGIELTEVDPNTMESRLVKGLYFAGEVLNVDGITGGFNFQNAWTTGWIAANAVTSSASVDLEND
jgi:predicted Rossmann fold flavoprotein